MKNVRMSRKVHEVPRQENKQTDISGLRGTKDHDMTGNTGLDNGQIIAQAKETRPFGSSTGKFPLTPQAKAAEDVDSGKEGKVRGRQADKSSKS